MRAPPASTSRRTASPTSRRCSTRSSRVWRRTARRWPRPTSRISRSSSSPYRPPTSAASRPASNTRRHFSPFDCCSTFDRGTQRRLPQRTFDLRPEPRPSRSGHPRPDPVSRSPLQQIRPSMRLTMIPHSRPSITDDDAERVARVVRSGQLAQGPEVAALERELAARLGVQDAAAVASGSAALELALGALGVGAGDEPAALFAAVREARDYDERTTLAPRTNAKLTDMAAALARGQLARLAAFIARRRALAARYRTGLASAPARLPTDAGRRHVYHRFVLGLDCAPAAVIEALATRGVAARRPVFRPAHRALGLDGFPEADRLWAASLSMACYPALTDDDAERVLRAVAAVLASAAEGNQSR